MSTATMPATLPAVERPIPRRIGDAELAEHVGRLDADGYTVIRGYLDHGSTERLRGITDAIRDGKGGHFRPPGPGAVMADFVSDGHVDLARRLLHAADLRLLEQVLACSPPSEERKPWFQWHLDGVFYPRHREARPRQTYFQFVYALTDIEPDRAPTWIVPGSHRKAYAASAALAEPTERFPVMDQKEMREEILRLAGIDVAEGIPITADEGDLYVFDPMCMHTASANLHDQARYVLFQTFVDASATEIIDHWAASNYPRRFSPEFRDRLPPHLRSLMDANNLLQGDAVKPWTPL